MIEERRKGDRRGAPVAPTRGDMERAIDPTRRRPTPEPEDGVEDFAEGFLGDDGP